MMSVIQNAYGNISSSFFGAKFQRFVEEMLVSPMPGWTILAGYVAGAVMRGLMVGVIVLGISLFFTKIHLYHPFVTLSTFLLAATIFALLGFINAIYARKFDDIAIIPTFVLTPLTYLGGVFYNVAQLPSPWREISYANPILYMVNTFRYGLLGVSDIDPAWAYVGDARRSSSCSARSASTCCIAASACAREARASTSGAKTNPEMSNRDRESP